MNRTTAVRPIRHVPKSKGRAESSSDWGRKALIGVSVVVVLSGVIYGWWRFSNARRVRQLHDQMVALMKDGPGRGPEGREQFREIRQQVDAMPSAYQQQFRDTMRNDFQRGMERRLDEFLALDAEARKKELQKRILEEEERNKQREARRKQREAEAAQAKANGTATNSGGANGQNGNGQNGPNGPGGPGGQNGGPGGQGGNGPGGRGGGQRGLAARLDNSTPQMRAKMAEYRLEMNAQRAQMGLPPQTGRGGGGFGGGGFGGGGRGPR